MLLWSCILITWYIKLWSNKTQINIKLQHPAALHKSDFAFCFFAIYVQHRLIFSCQFTFIVTIHFGLTGHHQVYRLLWLRNLLLTVMLFCFSYAAASDFRLCGLTTCFTWVSLNNFYACVCLMVLSVCGPWLSRNVSVGAEVCCMVVSHHSHSF
jgi:hypothetical protein